MKPDTFFTKYNGRYVDFDGKYGAQCVDLVRVYLKEALLLDPYAIPPVGYAKQIYKDFSPRNKFFIRIANDPLSIPVKGDIVVWDWRPPVTGIAGHVGIFSEGNVKKFIAFTQNYGTPPYSKFTSYDYRGVLGWLRKKEAV